MRKITVLLFCLVLMSCSKIETASSNNFLTNSNNIVSVSPTVEQVNLLKPVTPSVKLNSQQQKYFNESLPPQVREVLEKAETFEVLAEIRGKDEFDGEGRSFEPNRIAKITDENSKKQLLEAFYKDASEEVSPAACYEPHHGIKATYQGKTVEVEICFSCARFEVKSHFGEYFGTIVRDNRKSENILEQIITTKSIELKK